MSQTITHSLKVPARFSADIEREAQRELIEMGYGRLGLDERDLPGLHFAKMIHLGERFIRVETGSPAADGTNMLFMPMPFRNEAGNFAISTKRIYAQRIQAASPLSEGGFSEIQDPWTEEHLTLQIAFDPNGIDLRKRWIELLPQAVMSAEIQRAKSPLSRLARAIGL
jgi:hypothetical protein